MLGPLIVVILFVEITVGYQTRRGDQVLVWRAYPENRDYSSKFDSLGPFMKALMIGTCKNCGYQDLSSGSRPPPGPLTVGELTPHSPTLVVTNVKYEPPTYHYHAPIYVGKPEPVDYFDQEATVEAERNSLERFFYANPTPSPPEEPAVTFVVTPPPQEEPATYSFNWIDPTEPPTEKPEEVKAEQSLLQKLYNKIHQQNPEEGEYVLCPEVSC